MFTLKIIMFYWLQTRFQKHFKWLFVIILALVSVSFVLTVGNFSPLDAGARGGLVVNDFYGVNLSSRPETQPYIRNASITSLLDTGRPLGGQQMDSAVRSRIALLWLADQVNLPAPNKTELQAYIKNRPVFRNPDGSFNAEVYERVRKDLLPQNELTEKDFVLLMEENYRIERVRNLGMGPGYVLPQEAKFTLEDQRTQWSVAVAEFSMESFSPEIEVTEEELETFYRDNLSKYRTPAQLTATSLLFPYEKYTTGLPEPSDAQLEGFFTVNQFRFEQYRPKAEEADAPEFIWTNVPKETLIAEYQKDEARPLAEKAAQDFVIALHDAGIAYGSDSFTTMIEKKGLSLGEPETFAPNKNASNLLIPSTLRNQLFEYQGRRYFSDPFAVEAGILVAFIDSFQDASFPALDEVRDAVVADYKVEKKAELFIDKGEELAGELKGAEELSAFLASAKAASLVVEEYDAFTSQELPTGFSSSLLGRIQALETSSVSDFIKSGDNGYIVYVKEKVIPEISADDEELARSLEQTKNFAQQINQFLFSNELIRGGITEEVIEE